MASAGQNLARATEMLRARFVRSEIRFILQTKEHCLIFFCFSVVQRQQVRIIAF
jgi:hypothetical protein